MIIFNLNNNSKIPLYIQMYREIKKLIQNEVLKANEKLPSKKKFMEYYKISQNTIQNALYLLLEEGYIFSKERQGYFVSDIENLIKNEVKEKIKIEKQEMKKIKYNFSYSGVDKESFPSIILKKLTKEVYKKDEDDLLFQGDIQGYLPLRRVISEYLLQARGFKIDAEQIIINSGTEYLFYIIFKLFNKEKIYGVENPGYEMLNKLFSSNEIIFKAINLDENGIVIDELEKNEVSITCVTPSHQFPTGIIMPIKRRSELLNWANEKEERYIVEDDYDSEFKYNGRPIPALKAIDINDKVIYIGSFSRAISPSIRVSYMVLPRKLLSIYREKLPYFICPVSTSIQKILYRFLYDGYFEKHINKMRTIYKQKRELLVHFLKKFSKEILGEEIKIQGSDAGLHLIIHLPRKINEKNFLIACQQKEILIYEFQNYYLELPYNEENSSYLLGYANLKKDEIENAIFILIKTIQENYL